MNLSGMLDALAAGIVDHRAEGEALVSRLARHREDRIDLGLRLDALRISLRRAEHPRHLGAREIVGPRAAIRDGDPGSKSPAHDATESSLITMGLTRSRKATS